MNNVSLRFRENLTGFLQVVQDELDGLIAGLQGTWNVEHKAGGEHKRITADRVTLNTGGSLEGDLRFKGQQRWARGPWLLDEPGVVGTHLALLRPTQITANQNDYNPGGLDNALGLELDADQDDRTLTGISQPRVQKRLLLLGNISSYRIVLSHADSNSTATNRFSLPGAKNVILASGAYAWLCYNTSASRWNLIDPGFAGQLAFPATQNASSDANTLDEYEEGTWTPGAAFGGGAAGITYTTRDGVYQKTGQLVFASFNLLLSNKGSSTGAATITGLPFASHGATVTYPTTAVMYSALATTWVHVILQIDPGASTGTLYGATAAAAANATALQDTDFANTSLIRGTAVYRATA